jgi:iron complex outermembrane receptor protein
VNIVTSDLMDFASMEAFDDFYKVDASSSSGHAIDGFPTMFYRGFRQQGDNAVRMDGFRLPGNIDLDLAMFDRFEVIKGPTSTLYGQNSIGGTLNAVSKAPQQRFGARVDLEAGEHDDYRIDVDLTGPLAAREAWSYRLVGTYKDSDSFFDYVNKEVKLLAPSVSFRPSDSTRLLLRVAYQEVSDRFHRQPALQLRGDGAGGLIDRIVDEGLQIVDAPRSRFYSMPWNHDEREAFFAQFQGEHDLDGGWTLRLHAQHNEVDQWVNGFYVGGPIDLNGVVYYNEIFASDLHSELDGAEVNLFGDVEMFGRAHTIFLGVDYNRIRRTGLYDFGSNFGQGFSGSVFNVFAPDYTAVAPQVPYEDGYGYCGDSRNETKLFGATVQLILKPTDRLSVLLGARHTRDELLEVYRDAAGPFSNVALAEPYTGIDAEFSEEVFQGGVTFALTDAVNAYASYGETFEGQFGRVASEEAPEGHPIDPQEGTNYEVGLKGELSKDLSFNVAAFDMRRSNISQADIGNPGFVVPLGTQQGKGVELGLQGRLLPQLSVNASAAYLAAEYIDGEFEGLQPVNTPKLGFSVFGSYEVLEGALKGVGFGVGLVHKRDFVGFDAEWTREAGQPVTFDFGDFTEVDARVSYELERWSFTLSATNLFDEEYYSQSADYLWFLTNVNPPRTFRARASYRF